MSRSAMFPVPERLDVVAKTYPTPFHCYDEGLIRGRASYLLGTMQSSGFPDFQNYFAVKALPNPEIIKILMDEGMGLDCSSIAELAIAEMCGVKGEQIMFSSNNTTDEEFAYAARLGAIINFDDISLVRRYIDRFGAPYFASCRYNPGKVDFAADAKDIDIIGTPSAAKYGMPRDDLRESYRLLSAAGTEVFGIHTMLLSNDHAEENHLMIAQMLCDAMKDVSHHVGIKFSLMNLGGGIGVPYAPGDSEFPLESYAAKLRDMYIKNVDESIGNPRVVMENGRYISAQAGFLITRVINRKDTYRTYIGVDASMSDLMRPGMYGAYHHISTLSQTEAAEEEVVDVVGSLCENNDKFAEQRKLPKLEIGDTIAIHTTGAHGHAMGFQYNGKLRHAEVLLSTDGQSRIVRRAETLDDYFATLVNKGEYHVPTN